MAEDRYIALAEDLTSVADAIRSKSGVSGSLKFPDGFVSRISGITKASYVHRSGSFKPTADGASISIPARASGFPVFYYVCANEMTSESGIIYAAMFIDALRLLGSSIYILNTAYEGEYFVRIRNAGMQRLSITGGMVPTYCSSTALTPRSIMGGTQFSKDLTYKWYALYSV